MRNFFPILKPLRPLRGLDETRVATREESGVLGFPSRRGLTPRAETENQVWMSVLVHFLL